MIRLWKGYHSAELRELLKKSWRNSELLVLCPPLLQDLSFVSCLPAGDLEFYGDFSSEQKQVALSTPRQRIGFPEVPQIGVFTSGTLGGAPRLVLLTKENIESSLRSIVALFDTSRIESIYCLPQPFHIFGLTLGYVLSNLLDCELVTPAGKYSSASLEERLNYSKKNVLTLGTPTHFFDLLQKSRTLGKPMPASYSCIVGGAAVSKSLWLSMRDDLHIEAPSIGYGCTEASPGITNLGPGVEPNENSEIGFPLPSLTSSIVPGVGVEIDGPSRCFAVIQNGEIQFPGKMLIRDQIRVSSDGRWIYEGRTDLTLNRGGLKFPLEQIEQAIFADLQVLTVATNVTNERLGHDLALAILRKDFSKELIARVDASVKKNFGFTLNHANCVAFEEFPLNESAKLDRKKIGQWIQKDLP